MVFWLTSGKQSRRITARMLRLRLQRRGKRGFATYRVVVAEQTAPVKGRFVADVGWYNPHTDEFEVKAEEVTKWLSNGAQPSATVHNLLVTHGILKADKVTSWRPKKKPAKDDEVADAKSEVAATDQKAKASGEEKDKSSAEDTAVTDETKDTESSVAPEGT